MKKNNAYQCLSLTHCLCMQEVKSALFPSFIKLFICALAVRGGKRSTAAMCLTLIHHDLSQPGTLNIKEEREWKGDKQSSRHCENKQEKGPNQPSTYFPSLNWLYCIVIAHSNECVKRYVDVNTQTEKKKGTRLRTFLTQAQHYMSPLHIWGRLSIVNVVHRNIYSELRVSYPGQVLSKRCMTSSFLPTTIKSF